MAFEDYKSAHPAYRENDRLSDFVLDCRARGRISNADTQAVFDELVRIAEASGFTATAGFGGKYVENQGARLGLDDASTAVIRHTTHAMRKKLLELHPELADEVRRLEAEPGQAR